MGGLSAMLGLPWRLAVSAGAAGMAMSAVVLLFAPSDLKLAGVLLSAVLAWAAAIDIDRFILPDVLTLPLLLGGLGLAWFAGPDAVLDRVIGALAGYGSLGLLAVTYRRLRGRDGLGMGDAKLFAAAGAWLGWPLLPLVMLIASAAAIAWVVAGTALGRRLSGESRLPFGPFIAAGFWCVWVSEAI